MKLLESFALLLCVLSYSLSPAVGLGIPIQRKSESGLCQPWNVDKRDRVFVLTDVANEPDDQMSLVRLLTHSDLYSIQGIVAITSFWLPNATYPNIIHELVNAYGTVRENLQSHSNYTFPTAEYLDSRIASGPVVYGKRALTDLENGGPLSDGSSLLIDAVDASEEPLYAQIWGGENTVASALWWVNRTRSATHVAKFTSKLRVYSISDQDDTGEWCRTYFPGVRWVASRLGFNQYPLSTWRGISALDIDGDGPDTTIVSQAWLTKNIQDVGPMGKYYPNVEFVMEGDSPSLLYNMQTGLGDSAHPDWGSWGGRYKANPLNSYAQYADATDSVVGRDNKTYQSNHATIWRWRDAFQNEFAARMEWTLSPFDVSKTNTSHPPVVVVNGSCGAAALEMDVTVNSTVRLDASSSYSPDANANLNFTWFQYLEPSAYQESATSVPTLNFTESADGRSVEFATPQGAYGFCLAEQDITMAGSYGETQKCPTLHVVLAVRDLEKEKYMTRYKRILLHYQPYGKSPI